MKVYIVGGGYGVGSMYLNRGHEVVGEMEQADLVQFTGGEDVSPSLYKEAPHPKTFCSPTRDKVEEQEYKKAKALKKPCAGICRGGQFLNVMNGGKMYQHVENHTTNHVILDHHTGTRIMATSTHHQMMRPAENGIIVATANQAGKREYMKDGSIRSLNATMLDKDTEAVYYRDSHDFCFQPHPEFGNNKALEDYYFNTMKRLLGV